VVRSDSSASAAAAVPPARANPAATRSAPAHIVIASRIADPGRGSLELIGHDDGPGARSGDPARDLELVTTKGHDADGRAGCEGSLRDPHPAVTHHAGGPSHERAVGKPPLDRCVRRRREAPRVVRNASGDHVDVV
jgi:hypothetical protein